MKYNSKKNKKLNRKRNRLKYSKRKKISKKLNKKRNRQKSLFTKNKRIQKGGGKYKCAGDTWVPGPYIGHNMRQWNECPYDAYFFTPPMFGGDIGQEGWYTNKELYPFAKGIKGWSGVGGVNADREAGKQMTTLMGSVADQGGLWNDPSNSQCPICYRRRNFREWRYGPNQDPDGGFVAQILHPMHRRVLEEMYPRGQAGAAPRGDTNCPKIVGETPSSFQDYNYCVKTGEQDNVKFVAAHGEMLSSGEQFVLPPNIRVITLVDVGDRLIGMTTRHEGLNHLEEIFKLYDKGSTIFAENDNDPSNLTGEAREIVDTFRGREWANPKLNLGGSSINNMSLTFMGEQCNAGMRWAGFCEIYCYNKSKDDRKFLRSMRPDACGEKCWENYIPMPYLGDDGDITLKQLIERGNPDIPCLYIISACRSSGDLNATEVELLRELSRNNSDRGSIRHRTH